MYVEGYCERILVVVAGNDLCEWTRVSTYVVE